MFSLQTVLHQIGQAPGVRFRKSWLRYDHSGFPGHQSTGRRLPARGLGGKGETVHINQHEPAGR